MIRLLVSKIRNFATTMLLLTSPMLARQILHTEKRRCQSGVHHITFG